MTRGDPAKPRVDGRTARGQRCELVDCTGESLPQAELERLLADLIAAGAFDFRARGDAQGRLRLDQPELGHIQIGERLYRLVVERYRARLERF